MKSWSLVEKPRAEDAPSNLAVIGRYILTPTVFETLSDIKAGAGGELQLTDGLKQLLKKEKIYGYVFDGKRHDTGDKLGFLKATVEFALKRPDLGGPLRRVSEELESVRILGCRRERPRSCRQCATVLLRARAGSARAYTVDLRCSQRNLQLSRFLFHAVRQLLFVRRQLLGQRFAGQRQNLRRQNSGVGRAGLADRDRRHRNAGRHLHRRQQRIHALQRSGGNRHADDRQRSVRRDHARQVRRAAGAGDDHANPARRQLCAQIRRCGPESDARK